MKLERRSFLCSKNLESTMVYEVLEVEMEHHFFELDCTLK